MYTDTFGEDQLSNKYKALGQHISSEWSNTLDRRGYLRIISPPHLIQDFQNYIVAIQTNGIHFTATTQVDFLPINQGHRAGLIAYIDECNWYFLHLKGNSLGGQKYLQIESKVDSLITEHIKSLIHISKSDSLHLKLSVEEDKILFYYSTIKHQWHKVGPSLSLGSIEFEKLMQKEKFNPESKQEISVGMCVMNSSAEKIHADFKYFKYESHL